MANCNVCLYSGGDFGDNRFSKYEVTNKTPKSCCECGVKVPGGIPHEKAKMKHDEYGTTWTTYHTCPVCAEIAWAFFCDSRMYELLWEYMEEGAFEKLTQSCFNKLKTADAKKELQRRWTEWKGLAA